MDKLAGIDEQALTCGLSLNTLQRDQLNAYYQMLSKWSQRINLTSVTDSADLVRFHFLEGCWVAENFLGAAQTMADVGSGAGFPGLPIKLYRPRVELFLIEKNYKKSVFLMTLARELGLEVEVFSGHAEKFPCWERVDLAVIRALRPSSELLELLAKKGILLLILHGRDKPHPEGWQLVRRDRFPLSRNRWAALYR